MDWIWAGVRTFGVALFVSVVVGDALVAIRNNRNEGGAKPPFSWSQLAASLRHGFRRFDSRSRTPNEITSWGASAT